MKVTLNPGISYYKNMSALKPKTASFGLRDDSDKAASADEKPKVTDQVLIRQLMDETVQLGFKIEDLNEENRELKKNYIPLKDEYKELIGDYGKVVDENAKLKEKAVFLAVSNKELTAKNNELYEHNNRLAEKNTKLFAENKTLKKAIIQLKQSYSGDSQ